MKINKILQLSFVLATILNGASYTTTKLTDSQEKTGIELLLTQYDWTDFWEEYEIDAAQWGHCKTDDPKKGMFGMDAKMIEPLYLVDVTANPSKIQSVGITLGSEKPHQTGSLMNKGGAYVNVFKFPLMDMLMKKHTGGAFYFEQGTPKIVYIGKIDPSRNNDILANSLNPERALFANFLGALASAGNCLANETYDKLSGSMKRSSTIGKSLRSIIDPMYFSTGCGGITPTASISINNDPVASSNLMISNILYQMHLKKGLVNSIEVGQTIKSVLNGYSDSIMCKPKKGVIPMTQYKSQLLSPTVGGAHELGISALEFAFKTSNSTQKTVIMIISQRRDFRAFAYQGGIDE